MIHVTATIAVADHDRRRCAEQCPFLAGARWRWCKFGDVTLSTGPDPNPPRHPECLARTGDGGREEPEARRDG